jgi:ParB family transcriptional regulator, chromosome partitioning protein
MTSGMTPKAGRQPKGLGRGLGALLPVTTESAREIDIDLIAPNPSQPRKTIDANSINALAESVRRHGILQPLIVTRVEGDFSSSYVLIAGHRRLQAARRAGITRVPVVVREASDVQRLELALVENLQRSDLDPLEEAYAFRRLIDDFGLTQEEVAQRVGRSRVAVANALRLLGLSPAIREALVSGAITAGHARAILGVSGDAAQSNVLAQVVDRQLNVRQTEEIVRSFGEVLVPKKMRRVTTDPELAHLQDQLRAALETQVELLPSRSGGRILIRYYDDEDFQEILAVLLRGREGSARRP